MKFRCFKEIHNSFLSYGEKAAIYRLKDEMVIESITYAELYYKIVENYHQLLNFGIEDTNVCLLTTNVIDFTSVFIALMLSGNTVTIYEQINSQENHESYLEKLKDRIFDSKSTILICDTSDISNLTQIGCEKITFQSLNCGLNSKYSDNDVKNGKLIQYSSGSTSVPKGIVLTEENILENISGSIGIWELTSNDTFFLWARYSHLYGLATSLLLPLSLGSSIYQSSTEEILINPSKLIQIISNYKISFVAALNFTYDLCVKYSNHIDADLSCLRIAVIAGEMVKRKTLIDFYKKFRENGFEFESFSPSYGMTEASGFVSIMPRGSISNLQNEKYISVGFALPGKQIRIIDENHNYCKNGEYGEIVIDCEFSGYNNPFLNTVDLFYIDPNTNEKFFRTGDIGCILDNEIYIVGRKKEVIIQNGKKYYPVDLETISCGLDIRFDKYVVAFSYVDDNDLSEKVIIVQSVLNVENIDITSLKNKVRKEIYNKVLINVHDVIFVNSQDFPLTKMGKILRNDVKEAYLTKTINVIKDKTTEFQADISLEYKPLIKIWQNVLSVDIIHDVNSDFFELGGGSLRALELIVEIDKALHKKITIKEFMKNSTVKSLYDLLESKPLVEKVNEKKVNLLGNSLTDFKVTTLQEKLINFYGDHVNKYCAIMVFDINSDTFSPKDIYDAIKYVISKNLSTQLKIYKENNIFFQTRKSNIFDFEFDYYDFNDLEEFNKNIEIKQRTTKLLNCLDIFSGKTISVGYYKNFDRLNHSLLVFNGSHIFFDAHSIDLCYNQIFEYLYTHIRNYELDTSYFDYNKVMNELESKSVSNKKESLLKWKRIIKKDLNFPTLLQYHYKLYNSDRFERQINFRFDLSNSKLNIEHAIFVSFIRSVYDVFNIDHSDHIALHLQFNSRAIPTFELGKSFYKTMGTFNEVIPICPNHHSVSGDDNLSSYADYISTLVDDGKDFCLLRKNIFEDLEQERDIFKTRLNIFKSERSHEKASFVKGDRSRDIWQKTRTYSGMCNIEYLLDYSVVIFDDLLAITILYSKFHYNEEIMMDLTNKMIESFNKLIGSN